MSAKRNIYLLRFLLSFVIATAIFTSIFLVSYSISYFNYQSISSQNNIIEEYLKELELFLNSTECNNSLFFNASERLDIVGYRISILEERIGKKDFRVLEIKKLYSELEFKHFNIVKKLNSRCQTNFTNILFFYSNLEPYDKASEKVGFILSTFKKNNQEKVMIYSFDFNLKSNLTSYLLSNYNISKIPVIVVNERDTLSPTNIQELQTYVK